MTSKSQIERAQALRELFAERIVVLDGAMGTMIQQHKLDEAAYRGERFADWSRDLKGCNDLLVITKPKVIGDIHREFIDAGADLISTNTFNATSIAMADYGLESLVYELNREAAALARRVADEEAARLGRPVFVAGALGPTNRTASISPDVNDPGFRAVTFDDLVATYGEATRALIEGGADAILIETIFDTLNAKAAIYAVRTTLDQAGVDLPIIISGTITDASGRTLSGQTVEAFWASVRHARPITISLNCALGVKQLRPYVEELSRLADTHVGVYPNAGLPNAFGEYDEAPADTAAVLGDLAHHGHLNLVGGCCGTTPAHLAAVVEKLGPDRAPVVRTPEFDPGCSSIYSHVPFHQELAYLAIGERTNANGSKKFRESMLAQDWDTCVQMAREQVKEGAHVLDVCVDYVGRDGTVDMHEIASRFATQAALPLVFDSTEPAVLEAGLQHSGGKAILNSANLEEGEAEGKRFDRVMSLAREYGAAVIVLAIDEEGQARTADDKLRICRRIYDLAIDRYGIEPSDLIFDMLTFPLGSGSEDLRRDGIETIDAIRRAEAELPGSSTVLGLSNISFGLKPAIRHVLNSVFLHECR
ncbi:MAG TPA: homocysteine S-methyltransferase family protein, partial [Steroidobacteraceae bacterium]